MYKKTHASIFYHQKTKNLFYIWCFFGEYTLKIKTTKILLA